MYSCISRNIKFNKNSNVTGFSYCIHITTSTFMFSNNLQEIKDTTDSPKSACYLDLHLEIDSRGKLTTKLYDKRDSFNFPIVNFPFMSSNIPSAPAYGVYISQLIRYSRVFNTRISKTECTC